jgi:hypothetical protein
MVSNVTQKDISSRGLTQPANRVEKMAAFDQLPEPVRVRLANAQFDISPVDALKIVTRFGVQATLLQIVKTENRIKQHSNAWEGPPDA